MGRDPGADRESALFAASAAVGAMVLARATHDESLAGELLSAVRKGLLSTNEKAPLRRRPGKARLKRPSTYESSATSPYRSCSG